jgi:uncharacterized Tic20 family protein
MAEQIGTINHDINQSGNLKLWKFFAHLSSLAMLILIPYANIWGPLIVWKNKQKEYPELESDIKDEINFQITIDIILTIMFIGIIVLQMFISDIWGLYVIIPLFILMAIIFFVDVFLVVSKCMSIYQSGEYSPYPFSIPFWK